MHSSVGGHLGCFYILTIINSAGVNIGCTYLFKSVFLFCFSYVLRSGIAESYDSTRASLVAQLIRNQPAIQDQMVKNLPAKQETRVNSWVWKILWRREWQAPPVFLLENPMDRGGWRATVCGVAKSWTRLSNSHTHNEGISS